jgi:hypothetical protein
MTEALSKYFFRGHQASHPARQNGSMPNPHSISKNERTINITTINAEGRGNSMHLSELQKTADILCVQEHLLCEFQKHTLSTVLSEMDVAIRCSDSVEDIQNFNLPRGKGGVGIAWKKQ